MPTPAPDMPPNPSRPVATAVASDVCLVTGATGAIGPILIDALLAEGRAVRALVRTPLASAGEFPPAVEIVAGDVTSPASVADAMHGVRHVFHLAARLHVVNPSPALEGEYRRVNVEGTRHVIDAARAVGVDRVVFFSTISVYGPSRGARLDEGSPSRPETIYGATKHEAEQIALAARRADGLPLAVVLRLAAVYGTRVKGNYRRLLDALERHRFVRIGAGRNRRTLVHEDDVARAALLASAHPGAAGRAFNVTDGHVHTLDAILRAMSGALGRRPPRLALPARPVRVAATVADRLAGFTGRRLAIGSALDKYLEDVAVDGSLFARDIGFVPALTLDEGWRRSVDLLRRRGEL